MSLKKIFSFVLLGVLLFGLSSCKKTDADDWTSITYEAKIEVPDEYLLVPGKLIVATSPDYSPYEFEDIKKSGQASFQGADIYFASFIAQTLGLELEILKSSFDGLMTQLNLDKADIVVAGLTYSEAREENYQFTDVYYDSNDDEGSQVLITLTENLDKFNSKEALNNSDVTIGCQSASVQEELTKSQLPNAKIAQIGTIDTGIQRLKKGELDAVALSSVNAETVTMGDSSISIITAFQFDDSLYEGIRGLLAKNNSLVTYINEAIKLLPEGKYKEWLDLSQQYVLDLGIGDVAEKNFFERFASIIVDYGIEFLRGTGITLALSAITVVFGTIIAIVLQLIRKSRFLPLRAIGNVYVEFVRGIPLLLLLWLLYMISPAAWPGYISVSIALFLNSGAYVAEVIRGGVLAVDQGQYEAARTLGLSKLQAMKKIIFPQATKKILPALGNEFVALIKETSLASVFFIGDLMTIKNNITSITYLSIEPFIVVGIIYFVLTFGTTKLIKHFEAKMEA